MTLPYGARKSLSRIWRQSVQAPARKAKRSRQHALVTRPGEGGLLRCPSTATRAREPHKHHKKVCSQRTYNDRRSRSRRPPQTAATFPLARITKETTAHGCVGLPHRQPGRGRPSLVLALRKAHKALFTPRRAICRTPQPNTQTHTHAHTHTFVVAYANVPS